REQRGQRLGDAALHRRVREGVANEPGGGLCCESLPLVLRQDRVADLDQTLLVRGALVPTAPHDTLFPAGRANEVVGPPPGRGGFRLEPAERPLDRGGVVQLRRPVGGNGNAEQRRQG